MFSKVDIKLHNNQVISVEGLLATYLVYFMCNQKGICIGLICMGLVLHTKNYLFFP